MHQLAMITPTAAVVLSFLLASVCLLLLIKSRISGNSGVEHLRKRHRESKFQVNNLESVISAYPGVVLIWQQGEKTENGTWKRPRMVGSPATLAALQSTLAIESGENLTDGILKGLSQLSGRFIATKDDVNFTKALMELLTQGQSFSARLEMPHGHYIDAEGRVAHGQSIVWLNDQSVRGPDEANAIRRLDIIDIKEEHDLVAFIEMVNRAPFPVWRCDGQGKILWVNPAYVSAVAVDRMQTVINEQIHLDEVCAAQLNKTLETGEREEKIETVVISGRRRATQIVTLSLPGGAAGFAIDASEAESYKDILAHHVRAHDELLNNMEEAIVIFSSDQKMTFRNRSVEEVFDLPENSFSPELTHSQWLDRLRSLRKLPEQRDYAEWKAKELSFYTNWPKEVVPELWELPDGKILRFMRMRDANGSISLLFSDITDKMQLQSQYNTLINVQAATLDKLSEGIAVFGTDGRLKIFNKAFATLWDLSPDMLQNQPLFDGVIEEVLPLYHDKMFWQELKGRATDPDPQIRQQVQGEIRRSDDKTIAWLSKPLPDGATLMAWDDVTQERKTEAALIERAAALEAADAIKSDFVGHVSYQLRTPLTTISGYADFLQNGGAGELTDKQSEYVFAVQSASEDLGKIINDILDISAIEANVLDLELGDVDVYDLLLNSLDYVATKAEDTKKSLRLTCPEDVGIIRADETRLKQVVYNLLNNAIRFTKPGGHVELGARAADNGGVEIWVKDDGVGIPSERQPKVFETFQSTRGGAGLGLALVQRFIEVHGGWVDLASEENEGTHVTCYLPAVAPISSSRPELDL